VYAFLVVSPQHPRVDRSLAEGAALATLAAVLFGVTTPVIRRVGADADPFSTAMLLYAGAALATLRTAPSARQEASVRPEDLPRLVLVALVGGAAAPALFAWGLQRTSGTGASLLLNFEAIFTAILAWRFYGEALGRRVVAAVGLMTIGGILLGLTPRGASAGGLDGAAWGGVAVVAATLAWALDNALTRPLADLDPVQVVRFKGGLGALASLAVFVAFGRAFPSWPHAVALLACGATGYGASLRLYLLAQRRIGAARTGSLFALAPFVGAAVAWGLGERGQPTPTLAAGALFGLAVYLHVTEHHEHGHTHARLSHEHRHRHDDGHHGHPHEVEVVGAHSHPHTHEEQTHEHAHGPDTHHGHPHG
jgi:drug/metabolite transporter (DMT)-like permease